MADLDEELIARAVRWCADAGRHTTPDQVSAALRRLSWDELLAARALLADPPPARPLGPMALADMARGALPDVAAEREREGRYQADPQRAAPPPGSAPAVAPSTPAPVRARSGRARSERRAAQAAPPQIRRARDRVEPTPPPAPAHPRLEQLYESEGRAVLERLVREHGARRTPILRALARGWRREDGADVADADLVGLLDSHGMLRTFERRERDALLHDLRAAGGAALGAASRAGLSVEAYWEALRRLGATADAETIRDVHRDELRRRTTLTERARLVVGERERLRDLGLLAEMEEDLRRRLPEHLRALRAGAAGPLGPVLAQSLAIGIGDVQVLGASLELDLSAPGQQPGTGRAPRPRQASRPAVPGGRGAPGRASRGPSKGGAGRGTTPARTALAPRRGPGRRGSTPPRGGSGRGSRRP